MGIVYYENERIFKLDTPNSTYMFELVDKEGFMLHMYYGRRLSDYRTADLTRTDFGKAVPSNNERERCSFNDCMPFEYATHGLGDYRDDSFKVLNPEGYTATSLEYRSHIIYSGKPAIKGMPATFGKDDECTTLEIIADDPYNGLEVTLIYTVFEDV
ncbi:MAG: alpha-galactosidase, partial [Lachnospiraceae bacterium]|nr:alpha-galactosidase [Lachnospiraceae bacterium]